MRPATPPSLDISLPAVLQVKLFPWPPPEQLTILARDSLPPGTPDITPHLHQVINQLELDPHNTTRLAVTGFADGTLTAIATDYAHTQALNQLRPPDANFPLFGGPLGCNTIPVLNDGIALARRNPNHTTSPGIVWLPCEGVELTDLDSSPAPSPSPFLLDTTKCTLRLTAEELGVIPLTVVPLVLHLEPGRSSFTTVSYYDFCFEDLADTASTAPDGSEQTLIHLNRLEDVDYLAPPLICHYLTLAHQRHLLPF